MKGTWIFYCNDVFVSRFMFVVNVEEEESIPELLWWLKQGWWLRGR